MSAAADRLGTFRQALKAAGRPRLLAVLESLGDPAGGIDGGGDLPDRVASRLAEPGVAANLVGRLDPDARLGLGLFALAESAELGEPELTETLALLGADRPGEVLDTLVAVGALARRGAPGRDRRPGAPADLVAHPAALAAARVATPTAPGPPVVDSVRGAREADGLEPILRLAAAWQVVAESPLRLTQQATMYKRDRDRLESDPALSGPLADLPPGAPTESEGEGPAPWLDLAAGVGLLVQPSGSDQLDAAPDSYWADNAVHLPQMAALRWLTPRPLGADRPGLVPWRVAAMLWLAAQPAGSWTAVADLAEFLDRRGGLVDAESLAADLLGTAYAFGLVRAGEEDPGGRPAVQIADLGRYALALGPPPPPRPAFEQFLYVQPNFEVIAYRQGLTPILVGVLSRFARWKRLGAALELALTPESIDRGLAGGLTPAAVLDRLNRHAVRPPPPGVAEAVKTWAGRRERVTYHPSVTLVEFANGDDREAALALWPEPTEGTAAPVRVGDRLLLVEAEGSIPFDRFRLAGSRDYRRPPEPCVTVEPDGITLAVDLGRADLFVEAELARFADELADDNGRPVPPGELPRRRYRVGRSSLARASADGSAGATLSRWFRERTGAPPPPAIRLLLHADSEDPTSFRAGRAWVLRSPDPDLLDGLAQHPSTRSFLGERLGPLAVLVPERSAEALREAVAAMGLRLDLDED